MNNLKNYYERIPVTHDTNTSDQYPRNHINFSAILKPLQWIGNFYELFNSKAFMSKKAMLKEFDSAIPLDKYLGTEEDVNQMRQLLISYCHGIDNNPFLSSIGRFLVRTTGLDAIKNRKKVLQFYEKHKKFIEANGKFKAPVIITGSPRTGTTLLHRLLSEDQNSRSPYTFELEVPIPPLSKESKPMEDSRIKKSRAAIKTLTKLAPGFMEKFAESHVWSATEMEESIAYTLAHNGINQMNCPIAGKDHIMDLMKVDDKRSLFLYERLFFTTLDAYRPAKSHWVLKAPDYTLYFPHVFHEFEDAKVIITHRNPLITLPSLCRLWESWCIAFDQDGSFDKHQFGKLIQLIQKHYLYVPLDFRKEHKEIEQQIFDCIYDELFSDPIGMVKKIYQKFDLEYTKEFEERMKTYLKNNQQGKYGRHKYSLEEYGFVAENLNEEFKDYMNHYGFSIPQKKERPTSFDFLKSYK